MKDKKSAQKIVYDLFPDKNFFAFKIFEELSRAEESRKYLGLHYSSRYVCDLERLLDRKGIHFHFCCIVRCNMFLGLHDFLV